ncbi:MAG: uracil-DNA glycosylase [Christensenellaceae bacterium]|jgi:uracil-DNA glycosylase|nr:uracil-DNA glycosylase [Christensenellaceae bacterium]
MVNIGNSWDILLAESFKSEWYKKLRDFLVIEYRDNVVYPDKHDIFNALKVTSYENVKVVILGQDPYHNPGEAHGMCFSVSKGVKSPPSLMNVFKEIQTDLGTYIPNNGYLMSWAVEGVLLLNAILTVRRGNPLSHKGKGWEILTDKIIALLNEREDPIVFMLWGTNARSKKMLITNPSHLVLEAAHPSPLAAQYGFLGCRHFSKANKFLESLGKSAINWQITNL